MHAIRNYPSNLDTASLFMSSFLSLCASAHKSESESELREQCILRESSMETVTRDAK